MGEVLEFPVPESFMDDRLGAFEGAIRRRHARANQVLKGAEELLTDILVVSEASDLGVQSAKRRILT